MNERIKQLWSQAGGHYDSGNQHTWPQYTIDDPEKFAMLIVRECLDIVNRKEYSYHEADPLWETAQLIKKHFGVEE